MDLVTKQRSTLRSMSDNQLLAVIKSGTSVRDGRPTLDRAAITARRILRGRRFRSR